MIADSERDIRSEEGQEERTLTIELNLGGG
jgi:hypothetical protein